MPGRCVVRRAWCVDARGFTLVETMVVLAILGMMVAMGGLAMVSLRPSPQDDAFRQLARARAEAIRTGERVVVTHHAGRATHIVFLPDGRALGASVDPLTGTPR